MREMKDSGIDGLGTIPKHWKIKRAKYACDSLSKYNGSFIKCISSTDIELIPSPKYISKGDILFAGTGELVEEIGKNIVYMGEEKCLAGGDIVVMKHSLNPIFLNYALNCSYSQSQKSKGKAKLKVVHISARDIGNILIALPGINEQEKIANFLDQKCSEIDALYSDISGQISTLEEYKKSVITEAVTKGLNPDVEMKDSGINCIGSIPLSWKIIKTKYICQISIGLVTTMTTNYVQDPSEGVSLIRNGDIKINKIDTNGMVYLSQKFVEKNSNRRLKENDIVTVHTGNIGTSAIIENEFVGCVGFATIQSRPNRSIVNERYLCWFYNSNAFIEQCILHNTGDGRQNLNLYDFVDLWVALPDIKEQEIIADYIDQKCSEIDSLIREKKEQLKVLEEYKKSLIYEYVTGKKEVK